MTQLARTSSARRPPHVGDVGVPEGEATIPLKQGRNLWRLLRTDRDGVGEEQVIETVGPAIAKLIRPIGIQEGPWEIFRIDDGSGNPMWRIGDARPVELVGLERYELDRNLGPKLELPDGAQILAERLQYPGPTLPTVNAQRPWWVLVDLWWRRPDATVYWPGFRVNWLGNRIRTVVDADWVLDTAAYVPPAAEVKPDPGDASSLAAHGERIQGAAKQLIKFSAPPLVIGGGLALTVYILAKAGVFTRLLKGGKR